MSTFTVGPYTVRIGLRLDNPAFPAFLVYRRDKFIGRIFSHPDLGACEWLERRLREEKKVVPEPRARFIMRSFTKKRIGLEIEEEPA